LRQCVAKQRSDATHSAVAEQICVVVVVLLMVAKSQWKKKIKIVH
jgi:hypothetical protein